MCGKYGNIKALSRIAPPAILKQPRPHIEEYVVYICISSCGDILESLTTDRQHHPAENHFFLGTLQILLGSTAQRDEENQIQQITGPKARIRQEFKCQADIFIIPGSTAQKGNIQNQKDAIAHWQPGTPSSPAPRYNSQECKEYQFYRCHIEAGAIMDLTQ